MPLDREPYTGPEPGGLYVIRVEGGKSLGVGAPPDAFPDEPHYRSHFTTCPQADKWRR